MTCPALFDPMRDARGAQDRRGLDMDVQRLVTNMCVVSTALKVSDNLFRLLRVGGLLSNGLLFTNTDSLAAAESARGAHTHARADPTGDSLRESYQSHNSGRVIGGDGDGFDVSSLSSFSTALRTLSSASYLNPLDIVLAGLKGLYPLAELSGLLTALNSIRYVGSRVSMQICRYLCTYMQLNIYFHMPACLSANLPVC
jgi:hypothetical protein